MRIGMVHYAGPPLVGGVELTMYHHARVLLTLGHEVVVVAGRGEACVPGMVFHQVPQVGSRGARIEAINATLARGEIPDTFEPLVAEIRAALLDALGACDVVIGHNFFTLHKNLALTTAVYRMVTAREGPPWIAWHHDFAWLRPQYLPELHAGEPWELLRCPWPGVRHVTVSAAQRADLARLYGISAEMITVVPPGVEPTTLWRLPPRIADLVARWGLLQADVVFLLPARITRRKQIERALEWLAAMRTLTGEDARLVVTGPPGPHNPANQAYFQALVALRAQLGLADAAHFAYEAGVEPTDEEVAALYQVADALMFTSKQEGFGIPVLEAGVLRLPIFATDLPPFHESVGSEAHLFAPETPPEKVAAAIAQALHHDKALRLRKRMLREFTWQRIVEDRLLPLVQMTKQA
nr:glycosyltransferase family 4 protein [Ardenticatena sp.]